VDHLQQTRVTHRVERFREVQSMSSSTERPPLVESLSYPWDQRKQHGLWSALVHCREKLLYIWRFEDLPKIIIQNFNSSFSVYTIFAYFTKYHLSIILCLTVCIYLFIIRYLFHKFLNCVEENQVWLTAIVCVTDKLRGGLQSSLGPARTYRGTLHWEISEQRFSFYKSRVAKGHFNNHTTYRSD